MVAKAGIEPSTRGFLVLDSAPGTHTVVVDMWDAAGACALRLGQGEPLAARIVLDLVPVDPADD